MLSALPPAGNSVTLVPGKCPASLHNKYAAIYVQSGTAALALALRKALTRVEMHYQRDLATRRESPEVVMPGYACPDLVSAAVYAGVKPVLVDLEEDSHCMQLRAVESAVNANTVAIVAVNFLGLTEQLAALRRIANDNQLCLVEDNAQWLPPPATTLYGDYVVCSFGRGKPLSLLGGGALLCKDPADAQDSPTLEDQQNARAWRVKSRAYNLLRQPLFYGAFTHLPFLNLGATVYKPLEAVLAMDATRKQYLANSLAIHHDRAPLAQTLFDEHLLMDGNNYTAFERDHTQGDVCLLRYPLLVRERDRLLASFEKQGLGASAMYRKVLPKIANVGPLVQLQGDLVNAQSFADRLITLPVHDQVDENTVSKILALLESHG